jgi:hypothetical protein
MRRAGGSAPLKLGRGGDLRVVRFAEDSVLNAGSYDGWLLAREGLGPNKPAGAVRWTWRLDEPTN